MSHLVRLFASLCILSATACAAAPGEDSAFSSSNLSGSRALGETVVLTGDGVRLRTGPSSTRTVIASLFKGTELKLLASEEGATTANPSGDYYKVEVTKVLAGQAEENVGKTGWLAAKYLDGSAPAAVEGDEGEAAEGETETAEVPLPVPRPSDCNAPSNATQEAAQDLGSLTDASGRTRANVPGLKIASREAWFKMKVLDEGLNGNPSIKVDVNDVTLEVAVFFACATGTNASSCSTGTALPVTGAMMGCTGATTLQLDASCDATTNESGEAFVRIRKTGEINVCSSYDLGVQVF